MRFNKPPTKRDWHRWFAWFPVDVSETERAWLEIVERRGEVKWAELGGWYWLWEYRAALNKGDDRD